ncbi:MAG TPA: YoaK family protein, partial [Ktedonobacterales bacterium]|nr:YoaK family protein [Ktedonobacterales bacterium]
GYVDAVSYFGLGRVFTSVMTGNTVVLGVALSQGNWLDVARTLTALASYLVGVVIGTLVLERGEWKGIWPASVTVACLVELGALLAFAIVGVLTGSLTGGGVVYILIALAASAMGIQSASARVLNVSGVATTYFTGTWTALMEGVTRHLRVLAGRRTIAAPDRKLPSRQMLARQASVLCSYALAAIVGSASVIRWQLRAAALPVLPLILIICIAWLHFHRTAQQ